MIMARVGIVRMPVRVTLASSGVAVYPVKPDPTWCQRCLAGYGEPATEDVIPSWSPSQLVARTIEFLRCKTCGNTFAMPNQSSASESEG